LFQLCGRSIHYLILKATPRIDVIVDRLHYRLREWAALQSSSGVISSGLKQRSRRDKEETISSTCVVEGGYSPNENDKAKAGTIRIAKALKRTPGATRVMAAKLGVSLSTRG
jgi:hypothetical protein